MYCLLKEREDFRPTKHILNRSNTTKVGQGFVLVCVSCQVYIMFYPLVCEREIAETNDRKKVWPGVLCVSKPAPAAVMPERGRAAPRRSAAELCRTQPTLWGSAAGGRPDHRGRGRESEYLIKWKIIFCWREMNYSISLQLGSFSSLLAALKLQWLFHSDLGDIFVQKRFIWSIHFGSSFCF